MDQTLFMWISVVVISLLGTLAHFLYEVSNHSRIIGLFAAVNESVWEHVKIAITPTILWSLVDGALYGTNPNYFLAKIASLLVLTFFIPFVYYSYHRAAKKSILPLDIIIFYVAIILSQLTFHALINLPPQGQSVSYFTTLASFIFFGCYMTLTLFPQKAPIFKDPLTGKYGFLGHTHLKPTKKTKK